MKRDVLEQLINWKNDKDRKPLILQGARQVGKTWVLKELGKKYYDNFVYINFDNDEIAEEIFKDGLYPEKIVYNIEVLKNIRIEKEKTLIIFDEIQESDKGLRSLKYFDEDAKEYHVVSAGSFLGVKLHQGSSFPVGKVSFMNMYPMSFLEYLNARGLEKYVEIIQKEEYNSFSIIDRELKRLLKEYFIIGGMPEVVKNYITNGNFEKVKAVQKRLYESYINDFAKHAPVSIVPKIIKIFESIPYQLSNERKKFTYKEIDITARETTFGDALNWLENTGLIILVKRVSKIGVPLKFYFEDKFFKAFMLDVGLLSYFLNVEPAKILEDEFIFVEFKGALVEQYVIQQIYSNDDDIGYWKNDKSSTEVDFVYDYKNNIIPIEVKSGKNLKAKSLKSYMDKYNPVLAIRSSLVEYNDNNGLVDLPLYAISNLEKVAKRKI